ncbi:MAG: LysM peptidoglycan-binding domain-containing protein [Coprococcus sp.]
MIEIVYDKKTAENQMKSLRPYNIPKNIRQIGNAPAKKKIYIEDYVMTFLRKIAEPGNTVSRGAILLGEYFKDDEGEAIFISGAVEAQNLEFDVEQIKFDDQIWSGLYGEINKYFDNLAVVGWFLSRMGFSVEINDRITRLHMEHFRGNDKVLFMMDSLECDDAFYAYERGQMIRQKGYYIYYVRNEQMQNYIISRKNAVTEDRNLDVLRKDQAIVENFRDMNSMKKELRSKGRNYFAYAVGSFVMVFALSVGIVVTGSYDKMKNIESKIRRMEIENTDTDVEVFSNSADIKGNSGNSGDGIKTYTETTEQKEENSDAENNSEEWENSDTAAENTEKEERENDEEVWKGINEDNTRGQAYVVEEGDTLMSISIQMYDSPAYVEDILAANNLKPEDTIYVGQKIIIPYIE